MASFLLHGVSVVGAAARVPVDLAAGGGPPVAVAAGGHGSGPPSPGSGGQRDMEARLRCVVRREDGGRRQRHLAAVSGGD
jgi:hypothetical protein